jgi:hypothetical protein
MNSLLSVVTVTYGRNDVPEPFFVCPVVVDPTLRRLLRGSSKTVSTLVSDAACAVELVSRFERSTQYVDFAPRRDRAGGAIPMALRVQLVPGRRGTVARIAFADAMPGPCRCHGPG